MHMARVLIVDDDPDILRIVEKVMLMGNHTVHTANNAITAMDLLNSSQFDILITDANMPQFSGFELTQAIKNNKRFGRMAICMLTGLREKKDIDKAIRVGVDEYIVKPIDPAVLMQKIEAILIKKPPMDNPELVFPTKAKFAEARLTISTQIAKLTEVGFEIISSFDIPAGANVQFEIEIFAKMGMKNPPPLKIISSKKNAEGDYTIQVAFSLINNSLQEKIRQWIIAENMKKNIKKNEGAA
jgi:DNA-binding response OmpR family regulator